MTQPYQFTTVNEDERPKRDPSEFLMLGRCRNKLLIVRPLEYVREGFVTKDKPEGTDVVRADIALLDVINPAEDALTGDQLPGYAAGSQFRNQLVFPGYLKGTFKRYIGETLVGTIYTKPTQYSRPSLHFQDLSGDTQQVQRAQSFLLAFPEFLIPVEAAITKTEPEPPHAPAQPNGYSQDPWGQAQQPVSAQPQSVPPKMTTLDQMRQWNANSPAATEVPF